jgi:hypothetical protein
VHVAGIATPKLFEALDVPDILNPRAAKRDHVTRLGFAEAFARSVGFCVGDPGGRQCPRRIRARLFTAFILALPRGPGFDGSRVLFGLADDGSPKSTKMENASNQ